MKISDSTLKVLKNFAQINPGLLIRPGSTLSTIALTKKLVASAEVEEAFEVQAGIYDLKKFLSILTMFKDPDVEFGESSAVITSDHNRLEFVYSAPETIALPPEKGMSMPNPDASFELTAVQLKEALGAADVLGVPDLIFQGTSGQGGSVTVNARDAKNPSSHAFTSVITTDSETDFKVTFKTSALRLIPNDYTVSVSLKGIAKFESEGLTYYVASEK